jgi:hypothetical protein
VSQASSQIIFHQTNHKLCQPRSLPCIQIFFQLLSPAFNLIYIIHPTNRVIFPVFNLYFFLAYSQKANHQLNLKEPHQINHPIIQPSKNKLISLLLFPTPFHH